MLATIDPIALRLGPISIHWYAICIVSGLLLAVYLAQRLAPEKGINPEHILDFILLAFPIAIVGARLYYVIFQWSYYSQNPSEIFAIWNGGIAIYGGLIAGAAVLYWFAKRHAIAVLDFLDIAAPGVMIAQSIGRWGNFVNQEAYGKAVSQLNYLPEIIRQQMFIDGSYRVPTFLYESLWNLVGFSIILGLRYFNKGLRQGDVTSFYLILGMDLDALSLKACVRIVLCLPACVSHNGSAFPSLSLELSSYISVNNVKKQIIK